MTTGLARSRFESEIDDLTLYLLTHPSTCRSAPWLSRVGKGGFYSSEVSGKWCIVRSPDHIDDAWRAVEKLVRPGGLPCAKVSTLGARKITGHETHVICAYTRDWNDLDDVHAARGLLRSAGFTEPLHYKRDIDTMRPNPDFEFIYASK